MAVIVREEQVIGGQVRPGIATYYSSRPVTTAQLEQAQRLDDTLRARMQVIAQDLKNEGWLKLKNRPGVVRLWWHVGSRLRAFVDDLDVGPEEDRQFIWRALYDHAPELVPGKLGKRAERLQNSHFRYCYLLGKYELERVEAVGDWTSWVEIFDSERIRNDDRILDWLVGRATSGRPDWEEFMDRRRMSWFRPLAKGVRTRFLGRDTRGLDDDELSAELDEVFRDVSR